MDISQLQEELMATVAKVVLLNLEAKTITGMMEAANEEYQEALSNLQAVTEDAEKSYDRLAADIEQAWEDYETAKQALVLAIRADALTGGDSILSES